MRLPIQASWLLSACILLPAGAKEPDPKPLAPYLSCGATDSLLIVDSAGSFSGTRQIRAGWKTFDIRVLQGRRLMYAFKDADYFFANVKIERGGKYYPREKGWIIQGHKALKNVSQHEWRLNGFDVYGSEADTLDHGGVIGTYTAFADTNRLVITAYLLNQGQKARRFHDIASFRALRADFLGRFTACVDSVARGYEF